MMESCGIEAMERLTYQLITGSRPWLTSLCTANNGVLFLDGGSFSGICQDSLEGGLQDGDMLTDTYVGKKKL